MNKCLHDWQCAKYGWKCQSRNKQYRRGSCKTPRNAAPDGLRRGAFCKLKSSAAHCGGGAEERGQVFTIHILLLTLARYCTDSSDSFMNESPTIPADGQKSGLVGQTVVLFLKSFHQGANSAEFFICHAFRVFLDIHAKLGIILFYEVYFCLIVIQQ